VESVAVKCIRYNETSMKGFKMKARPWIRLRVDGAGKWIAM